MDKEKASPTQSGQLKPAATASASPAATTPDQVSYVKPELTVVGPLRQVTGFETFVPPAEEDQEPPSSD